MKRSSSSLNQRKADYTSSCSIDDMDDEKDESKRKSRNLSEKKRRDQFNMLINELCSMVSTNNQKMDKSTVLRSTISFLRNHSEISVHSECTEVQENWKPSFLSNEEFTHLMLEAMDGFILVFSISGRILYMSESITSLLGYLPNDLSSSIFEVVHESDKPSLFKLLNNAPTSTEMNHLDTIDNCVSILLHMKHGPIYSPESPTYELVRLMGTFHHWSSSSNDGILRSSICNLDYDSNSGSSVCSPTTPGLSEWRSCFVAMARFQNPQLLREMTVSDGSKNEFISRHSLEWKFLFLDHRAPPIIGYLPFEVLGTSGYDYYHIDDLDRVTSCHEALMQTGEGTSCYYRFLTKGQQWIWLQTRYFITYHQWNSKPEFIVCTHNVISYDEVQSSFFKDKQKLNSNGAETSKDEHFSTQMNSNAALTSNRNNRQSPAPSISSKCSVSSRCSEMSPVSSSIRPSAGTERSNTSNQTPLRLQNVPRRMSSTANHLSGSRSDLNARIERNPSQEYPLIEDSSNSNNNSNHTLTSNVPVMDEAVITTPRTLTRANSVQEPNVQHTTPCLAAAVSMPSMIEMDNQALATENNPEQDNPGGERPNSAASGSSGDAGSNKTQIQDYLQRRHQLLQQQIIFQQEELRRVSEQLMLVQFVSPNMAETSVPCQETGHTNVTLVHPMLSPQPNSGGQHLQILTHQHLPQSMGSIISIPKSALLNSNAHLNQQPAVTQIFSPTNHLMSQLSRSEEEAHGVFAQTFGPTPPHCF